MELHVVGSAGTAPRPGHPSSGYLVRAGDTTILLDAGPGVAMALMELMDPVDLDAIVLSHRHPDHCSDFFALFHHYAYENAPSQPVVVLSPLDLWDAARVFVDQSEAWERSFAWSEAAGSVAVGDVEMSFGAAAHPVSTVCVRVEAEGSSFTYSADTGPGGELETLASGTGTLLCEATFQDATHDGYPYHLSARQAGEVAARAGVSRLVLTHLRSSLDPEVSRAEAAAAFDGEVLLAEPGMRIEI